MIHVPFKFIRRLIEFVVPYWLVNRLPRQFRTPIWARVHGPLRHSRAFPGIDREWVAYSTLRQAALINKNPFSVLEFGCAFGTFTEKLLSLIQYIGVQDRVTVFAFDTFSGMPPPKNSGDALPFSPFSKGQPWREGAFAAEYEQVRGRLERKRFTNFNLIKGTFSESLDKNTVEKINSVQPALIIVDCDYYSSTREALEKILPACASGTVFYFDDVWFNWYSARTGELRAIQEVNMGKMGEQFELVEDFRLGMLSRRVYRLVRHDAQADTRENVADLNI